MVSEALFGALPVEEIFVAASDGTRLHHAVYRPDTDEPVPVFINFSPYWGNTAETGGDGFGQYLLEHLVPRGYAVVLAAVRGTGHSEGCFEVASDREVEDLYDVIDHFANVEWSSGAIAAGGKSYDSTTQNGLIAKMPHPALKGLFHVSGITDMYRYNYANGVPYANGLTFTPRYATDYSQDGSHPDGDVQNLIDMACPEMAEHVVSGTGSAAHGLKDAYWQERDWTQFISESAWNGSIFFVHGFQDWNVKPDHILPWIQNLPPEIRVKGWLHQDTENNGHVYPMRADWNETMLAWLETELKGKDLGFWDGPSWDLEGTDGLWRSAKAWPPEPTMLGPSSEITTPGDLKVLSSRFEFPDGARITGSPLLEIVALAPDPESILTATFYVDDGMTRTWVGEAVLRAAYAGGLDSPSPAIPFVTPDFIMEAYPMDVVVPKGGALVVAFGEPARHAITTPAQTQSVVYETPVLWLPLGGMTAREDQPRATSCFAC